MYSIIHSFHADLKYTQIKIKRKKREMARNNNLKKLKKRSITFSLATELPLTANERKMRRMQCFLFNRPYITCRLRKRCVQ